MENDSLASLANADGSLSVVALIEEIQRKNEYIKVLEACVNCVYDNPCRGYVLRSCEDVYRWRKDHYDGRPAWRDSTVSS